jgi:hypothetical protein
MTPNENIQNLVAMAETSIYFTSRMTDERILKQILRYKRKRCQD